MSVVYDNATVSSDESKEGDPVAGGGACRSGGGGVELTPRTSRRSVSLLRLVSAEDQGVRQFTMLQFHLKTGSLESTRVRGRAGHREGKVEEMIVRAWARISLTPDRRSGTKSGRKNGSLRGRKESVYDVKDYCERLPEESVRLIVWRRTTRKRSERDGKTT